MARKGRKKTQPAEQGEARRSPSEPGWSDFLERRSFWIALGAMLLLLVVFFYPVFFGGQGFLNADNAASAAHRPFVEEAFNSSGSLLDRYPLWTPYIFSGMPSYGSLIAAPYMSLRSVVMAPVPGVFKVLAYYLILGVFVWLFLRRRGLDTVSATVGGVAYIFSAHIITMIMFGHNSKIATLMFLPLILLATDEIWDRPSLRWTSILALAVGNMLASSHLQIAYYTLLAAGLYLLVATVYSLKAGKKAVSILGSWGAWVGGLVVSLGSAAVIFLPVREYAEHSIRGGTGGGLSYDYATNWSLHPLEIFPTTWGSWCCSWPS
jgi:hypothetical protein